jgi:hypothetical protein
MLYIVVRLGFNIVWLIGWDANRCFNFQL